MKAKVVFTAILIAIVLASACKKKKQETETPAEVVPITQAATYPNYSQLKKGNYWVYERFRVAQDNSITSLHQFDSCYIEKDSVIRGQVYFKFHKYDFLYGRPENIFIRDSLHYIINSGGKIIFSSEDFSTTFSTFYMTNEGPSGNPDTLYKITQKMTDKDLMIAVPAGNFKTSNNQTTYLAVNGFASGNPVNPRYMNMRYSKNVGLVLETEPFYATETYSNERRLVRYHLN